MYIHLANVLVCVFFFTRTRFILKVIARKGGSCAAGDVGYRQCKRYMLVGIYFLKVYAKVLRKGRFFFLTFIFVPRHFINISLYFECFMRLLKYNIPTFLNLPKVHAQTLKNIGRLLYELSNLTWPQS